MKKSPYNHLKKRDEMALGCIECLPHRIKEPLEVHDQNFKGDKVTWFRVFVLPPDQLQVQNNSDLDLTRM